MENNLPPQTSNHDASTKHDDVGASRAHEAPDSIPTTSVDDHPTATARHAIEIVRKLSPTMREAIKSAPNFEDVRWTRAGTVKALVARGIAVPAADWYGPAAFTLTDLGRTVRAVLLTSEAEVLAHAERRDAMEATERARTADAERRAFSTDGDHAFCADCAYAISGHTPDRRPAAYPGAVEPCDKRQDECEGMPILPSADWGTAGRTWQDWVTHVRRYREART